MIARYECRVHARNRHVSYGTPVSVLAESRVEAETRAIDLVWSGNRRDARVVVEAIHDEHRSTVTITDEDVDVALVAFYGYGPHTPFRRQAMRNALEAVTVKTL